LIFNGDLESTTQTVHYRQSATWLPATFASGWGRANIGTPDVFTDNTFGTCGSINDLSANPANSTCYPEACVSDNNFGYQLPRPHTAVDDQNTTPNHNYVFLHNSEYLQQHLSAPLVAGSCYHLQFWVSRCDKDGQESRMQAVFSATDMNNNTTGPIAPPADALVLTNHHFNEQKLNSGAHMGWELVEFDFIAVPNCNYLTIGIFDNTNTNAGTVTQSESTVPGDCMTCGTANCITTGLYFGLHAYFVDDISLKPAAGTFVASHAFTNATIVAANSYSNSSILLTGQINISGTVTWTNCDVRCNIDAIITIPAGATLNIDRTSLSAGCNLMWKGIVVNGNGKLIMSSASIADAITGVTFNQGQWQISGPNSINSRFDRNVTDIIINNSSTSATNIIKATTFDHTQPLLDPSQTTNGYGTTGIVFNAQTPTSAIVETVGGVNNGDGCTFLGGVNGITSVKRNIKVIGCTFTNITLYDIYFQGNDYPTKRSLTVSGSKFNSTQTATDWGIFCTTSTNLSVKASKFDRKALGIAWYDSPNCDLTIGQAGSTSQDAQQGNIFTSCVYGVAVYNDRSIVNSTVQYAGGNFSTGNIYTDVVIANNSFFGNITNPSNVITDDEQNALWMAEPNSGSDVSYHSLNISQNYLQGCKSGIELWNINGWGIYPPAVPSGISVPSTNFAFKIENNTVHTSTTYTPLARGITIRNSPGTYVDANQVVSDDPNHWQNYGVWLDHSYNTELVGNFVQAGTGIVVGGNNIGSDIHCNTIYASSCGIDLAYSQLRSQGVYHGIYSSSGSESFNNYFTGSVPYHVDFLNYYCNNSINQWIWDGSMTTFLPTVKDASSGFFEHNGHIGSILSPPLPNSSIAVTGTDNCSTYPDYHRLSGTQVPAGNTNVAQSLSDPVAQWVADYIYQVNKENGMSGSSGQASQNIKRIIKIENAITEQDFNLANAQMSGFTPSNTVEQNYKDYLTVLLAVDNPVRTATQPEKNILIAIAQQNPRVGGPSVYLARAYLFYSDRMTFQDEDYAEPKIYGTAYIQSPCCLTPASGTTLTLVDAGGTELPMNGAKVYQDGSFAFDPFELSYYSSLNPTTLYRIAEKQPSKFTSLGKDFKTISDWIAVSPVTVYLGGAKLDTTKVTVTQDTVIARVTSVPDGYGNTVSISTTNSTNSDFVVQKTNASNQLIWSRTFDGPSSGADSTESVAVDNEGSVYVAGKVWNGNHYDFQTLKYDSTGFLTWSSLLEDTLGRNNEPIGIGVCSWDHSVYVAGKCCSGNQVHYRYAKYTQCITTTSNRVMQQDLDTPTPTMPTFIEYYPNPNDGKFNIVLKNSTGGVFILMDVNGKAVLTKEITQDVTIDTGELQLSDGVYLFKFTDVSGTPQFGRLVISHN
jgi:hypothetical protein